MIIASLDIKTHYVVRRLLCALFVFSSCFAATPLCAGASSFDRLCERYGCDTLPIAGHCVERVRYSRTLHLERDGKVQPRFQYTIWRVDARHLLRSERLSSTDPRMLRIDLEKGEPEIIVFPDSSLGIWTQGYDSPFSYSMNGGCSREWYELHHLALRDSVVLSLETADCPEAFFRANEQSLYAETSQDMSIYDTIANNKWEYCGVRYLPNDNAVVCRFFGLKMDFNNAGKPIHVKRDYSTTTWRFDFVKKNGIWSARRRRPF